MKIVVLVVAIIISFLVGSIGTYFLLNQNAVTTTTTQKSTSTLTNIITEPMISTATLIQTTSATTTAITTVDSTNIITQTVGSTRTITAAAITSAPLQSSFSFNEKNALGYFKSLNTTTGLLRDYQNDSHIFLADDQALDYNALMDIYASSGDAIAMQLANQINKSMSQNYGGLFQYWNPIFTLFGHYPSPKVWNVTTGYNQIFANNSGYSIEATIFPTNTPHPIEIKQYADIGLYYTIWNILVSNVTGSGGNITQASNIFNAIQTECANYGCEDAGYFSPSVPSTVVFSSYKIALDLIAYKELLASGAFNSINTVEVNQTINHLLCVANQLQAPDGGVYTHYNAYGDIIVPFGLGSFSSENGETTSLFALAYNLWNTGHLT